MGNFTIFQMFENPRRGRQARNFTTNVPKILDLKSSSEQIFFRKLSLGAPDYSRLRVCTCDAEPSCSTAFSTGYASRRSSSYKSLEQLFRIHLGSVVQPGQRSVYYSCKMFPSLPPSLPLGFVSAVRSSALRLSLSSDFHQACWQRCRFISQPCEKRFFSCMAFSVYEVIRVACLSRGWFVYNPCLFLPASNQTNYATGKPRE